MDILKGSFDQSKTKFDTRITAKHDIVDRIQRATVWNIKRYESNKHLKEGYIYDEKECKDLFDGMPQFSTINGNVLTNVGIQNLLKLGMTTGGVQWANGNAFLAVGTSATGELATDTGITAGAVYQAMDATWPQISSQTITFQSTYASGSANQAWNEYGVFTTNAGANMLNHKTSAQGTKVSGQSWQLQLAITFS
jgi:hypothetical protein